MADDVTTPGGRAPAGVPAVREPAAAEANAAADANGALAPLEAAGTSARGPLPAAGARGPLRAGLGFAAGVGMLLRGIGMYARSPRLMILGLIPAVISAVALVAAFVTMIYFVDDVATWVTPFAEDWASGLRETTRVVAMIAIAGVWTVVSILLFTALTLAIGQPFYEAISKRVEDQYGGVANEIDVSFWRTLPRTIGESLRLLALALVFGVLAFALELIPVVGQVGAPVLGALLGGWLLAVELTSVPFERRGLHLRERRAVLKTRRSMSVGFGVATFVCFLVPLGAVLLMPAGVAGATLLSRRLLSLPDAQPQ